MTFQELVERFYVEYHLGDDPNEIIYKYGFFDLIKYDNGELVALCSEGERLLDRLRLPNVEVILDEMEQNARS